MLIYVAAYVLLVAVLLLVGRVIRLQKSLASAKRFIASMVSLSTVQERLAGIARQCLQTYEGMKAESDPAMKLALGRAFTRLHSQKFPLEYYEARKRGFCVSPEWTVHLSPDDRERFYSLR